MYLHNMLALPKESWRWLFFLLVQWTSYHSFSVLKNIYFYKQMVGWCFGQDRRFMVMLCFRIVPARQSLIPFNWNLSGKQTINNRDTTQGEKLQHFTNDSSQPQKKGDHHYHLPTQTVHYKKGHLSKLPYPYHPCMVYYLHLVVFNGKIW